MKNLPHEYHSFRKHAHAVTHALLHLLTYRKRIGEAFEPKGIVSDLRAVFTWSSVCECVCVCVCVCVYVCVCVCMCVMYFNSTISSAQRGDGAAVGLHIMPHEHTSSPLPGMPARR